MFLSLTYPEISNIIKQKAGHDIKLAYKNQNTVTATYKASMEIPLIRKSVSKDINVDLQVIEVKDNQLTIRIDAGLAGNFALGAVQNFLVALIPLTICPGADDGRSFFLNLRNIEQLKPVLEHMVINSLCICPEDIKIDAMLKPKTP